MWLKLTSASAKSKAVYVNSDLIKLFSIDSDGATALILLGDGHDECVPVVEAPEQIMAMMREETEIRGSFDAEMLQECPTCAPRDEPQMEEGEYYTFHRCPICDREWTWRDIDAYHAEMDARELSDETD